jgi:hypothetical protein
MKHNNQAQAQQQHEQRAASFDLEHSNSKHKPNNCCHQHHDLY